MFEWIKKIIGKIPFTTEEVIRCKVCYLKATHELSLSAVNLETEQLEEIQIEICAGCLKEIKIKMNVINNENERSS
jgi:hypothetical protein